jgi:hypothetical protein
MGRYGAARPVRVIIGTLFGAGVFAASSLALFNLAASAGTSSSLLSPVTNTVSGTTSAVTGTVSTLTGPSSLLCQLACSSSQPLQQPQTPQNPLPTSLPCLNAALCQTQPQGSGSTSSNNTSTTDPGNTAQQPAGATGSGASSHSAGTADPPVAVPQGIAATTGSLVQPPPPSITLPTAAGGINFGKAPFLWPLFLGLDVLGAGAVVLALRKTWSKPAAD